MNPKPPTENQTRILWFALTGLAVITVIILVVAAVWGLSRLLDVLSPVLWPLAVAAVVACLLSPLVDWIEKRHMPRTRAIILVFIVAFALVAGVLASVIPQVVVETQQLASKVPEYSERLQQHIGKLIAEPPAFLRHFLPAPSNAATDTNSPAATDNPVLASATTWLAGTLPTLGSWLLGKIGKVASGFGILAGLVLIPVYSFYFLLEKRGIQSHWKEYLPVRDSAAKDEIIFVLDAIGQYLVAFFRGQVLVAMCDAVLYTIGFLIVGVNYAFLLGFVAVFLTIIPYLGAFVIFITALTLTFVQYGDWAHPLMVLGVFVVVQTLEGFVISPKIIGDRVGLHPLVIIIAVMAGTTLLGGILGGVLAIPLAAALRVILARYVWRKREM
jgi:predicted PurR-regulated permease PerM